MAKLPIPLPVGAAVERPVQKEDGVLRKLLLIKEVTDMAVGKAM